MDDIILISKKETWDRERFLEDFTKSTCYWDPLTLEETHDGYFLENYMQCDGKSIKFRLKNKNEQTTEVWRYHHYASLMSYSVKRATLIATLKKLHTMASDNKELLHSASRKLEEFRLLKYPLGIRRYMCSIMARDTANMTWRTIREQQQPE